MREVKVFKWEQKEIDGKWKNVQVFDCIALFHAFGQEVDGEGQSNPVAIVERADGKVQTIVVWMIEFVDGPKGAEVQLAHADGAALRDRFAMSALQGMCASGRDIPENFAELAYAAADQMIAERAK